MAGNATCVPARAPPMPDGAGMERVIGGLSPGGGGDAASEEQWDHLQDFGVLSAPKPKPISCVTPSPLRQEAQSVALQAKKIVHGVVPIAGIVGGALSGAAAAGPMGAISGAAAGFAGGQGYKKDAGAMAEQVVLMAHGVHDMVCSKCSVMYSTTRSPGQEGYGICQGCRTKVLDDPPRAVQAPLPMPVPNDAPAAVKEVMLQLVAGSSVKVFSQGLQSWFDARVLNQDSSGNVSVQYNHNGARKTVLSTDVPTYIRPLPMPVPSDVPANVKVLPQFIAGSSVKVFSQGLQSWIDARVLNQDSSGNVAVQYNHNGATKTVLGTDVPTYIRSHPATSATLPEGQAVEVFSKSNGGWVPAWVVSTDAQGVTLEFRNSQGLARKDVPHNLVPEHVRRA